MPQLIKPSVSIQEKVVALTGALTLAYSAWGFGGVIDWSLHTLLAGGLLTFVVSMIPFSARRSQSSASAGSLREQAGGSKSGAGARLKQSADSQSEKSLNIQPSACDVRRARASGLRLLVRTPAGYFAAAFLLYLAIAACNPAWQIASDQRGWWLESVVPPLGSWLPTSVEASYEPMNAWRIFNMHLAAFSLAFGLYLGLSSRRTTQFVLWFFLTNVALMAAVAIAQKYTQADAVLWWLHSENQHFWGSFFYRNQGAAFLNWGIVIAGILYFYHAHRCRQEARSGGPHFLAFCLIGLIAASIGLALSRGGILFAAILIALLLIFVLADYVYHTVAQLSRHTLLITSALTLTFALLLSAGLFQANRAIDWQAVEQRFGDIEATIDNAERDARVLSSKATWLMAQEQLWTGWGAGSFRYAFPMYQQEINELFYSHYHRKKGWMGRKFYRYAHNDILQFLAEYGIVGSALLLLTIASLVLPALASIRTVPFAILYLIAGIACAMGHAFLDFIYHSPAYWVAFITGIALTSHLLRLETKRS